MARNKRAKKESTCAATPLQLYKQAVRLVKQQPCGDINSDDLIIQKLQECIRTREITHEDQQTVQHSLDLELEDEPLYLLASAHLQLGQLYQRQEQLGPAQQHLQDSLKFFPRFAAAHTALGQLLRYSAASAAELQQAEHCLSSAISIAEHLSQQESGLLVDSNKTCAAELDAADDARSALAMLLCQSGREDEAVPHLSALGYSFRLAKEVLHYAVPHCIAPAAKTTHGDVQASDNKNLSRPFLQILDNALPQALLQHLQQAFAPTSPFWSEHNYGRVGYFSYMFSLADPQSSCMHQLAHHLQQLAVKYFPAAAEAKYAEFWAHSRRHSSGHQLHYDSDDEGQGGIRNPVFTSVLYLDPNTSTKDTNSSGSLDNLCGVDTPSMPQGSDCTDSGHSGQTFVGGPTLVTDQVLGGPLAAKGWLSYPAVNRFTVFDGRYLHGVIPGRGVSPPGDGRRCTLMMAFWNDLRVRTPPGANVGACMLMPDVQDDTLQQWPQMLKPREGGWGSCQPVPAQTPPSVSRVWQPVSGASTATAASYYACFQGF